MNALCFSPDSKFALSSSQSERHVAVWKASGKASKKYKAPVALLSMEQPPTQLDTASASNSTEASHFNVLAVSTTGRVCVWLCEVGHTVEATLRATIQIQQESARQGLHAVGVQSICKGRLGIVNCSSISAGTYPHWQMLLRPGIPCAPEHRCICHVILT